MNLADKLGIAVFALWWSFAIIVSDGACPMHNACSDLNYQVPAAAWIVMRTVSLVRRSRTVTQYAPAYWRTMRGCARFGDSD